MIGFTGLGAHRLAKADLRRNCDLEIVPNATDGFTMTNNPHLGNPLILQILIQTTDTRAGTPARPQPT